MTATCSVCLRSASWVSTVKHLRAFSRIATDLVAVTVIFQGCFDVCGDILKFGLWIFEKKGFVRAPIDHLRGL